MKKQIVISIGLLVFAWLLTASFVPTLSESVSSENKDFEVGEFHSLGIALNAIVYVEQGNKCSLNIEASPDNLDEIEAEVKDGKLTIKPKKNNLNIKGDIIIRVVAPDYKSIGISGSAKVLSEKNMNLQESSLKIAGSGSMKFDQLSSKELKIKIAGSGKMELAGKGAEEMEVSIAGSGTVLASSFMVSEFNGRISGSGDCKVFVKDELYANIAGSGSIEYKGTPRVESSVAGSGKVKGI